MSDKRNSNGRPILSIVPKSSAPRPLPMRGSDPVVEHLKRRGLPVTRENYLNWAYPEGAPDPMPGELEAIVQDALKNAALPEGYNEEGLAESEAWQKHRHKQRPRGV
ncbi:MAG: hypothetical protein ACXWCW_26815 [Burkholderiales bacterium]